jgi:hypothetical protein
VLPARDDRGGAYTLQWFTNARLERRPDGHGGTAVTVASLGRESLLRRGWLP